MAENGILTECLDDLERRIDPAVEDQLLEQWTAFVEGRFNGELFSPRRPAPAPPGLDWPRVTVNETLNDNDQMALQQFAQCSAQLAAGGGQLLMVRCNYGTGILPSLFGAEPFIMDDALDTLPTNRPLPGGKDAIRHALERGAPDIHSALGGKTLDMGRRFMALMERYPKINRCVRIYHPDLQGPMDICELLWGSGLFLDLVLEPELVHDFLALITETYTRLMRAWRERVPSTAPHAPHWGLLHRGSIMLRDDSAMNLSPAMFDEFIKPYDGRLLHEFGGGAIHFCGRGDHFIENLSTIEGVHAVNLSQPEYNDMETIYRHTIDQGIQLVGLLEATARQALAQGRDLHGNVCSI